MLLHIGRSLGVYFSPDCKAKGRYYEENYVHRELFSLVFFLYQCCGLITPLFDSVRPKLSMTHHCQNSLIKKVVKCFKTCARNESFHNTALIETSDTSRGKSYRMNPNILLQISVDLITLLFCGKDNVPTKL